MVILNDILFLWTNGGLNHEHMVVLLGLTLGDVVLQTNLKLVHDIKPKTWGFAMLHGSAAKLGISPTQIGGKRGYNLHGIYYKVPW